MFFYSLSVLHGVTDTCSFLDAPFFTAKVFLGGDITNFCQLYNLQTQCSSCVKHLFAKHAFLGDLGECYHLELATLRLHLGSGSVFRQRCKYLAILFNDCSIA